MCMDIPIVLMTPKAILILSGMAVCFCFFFCFRCCCNYCCHLITVVVVVVPLWIHIVSGLLGCDKIAYWSCNNQAENIEIVCIFLKVIWNAWQVCLHIHRTFRSFFLQWYHWRYRVLERQRSNRTNGKNYNGFIKLKSGGN